MNINEAIQSALEHYQAGNLQQAEYICKEILKIQPDNVDTLHLLGVLCYQLKDYDSAVEYIKKALQFNPANAEAYYNLANIFKDIWRHEEAITYYKKAINLNSNLVAAYCNLGIALQEKGQVDEAITCYQKALQLNPNLADVYYNLGTALQDRNQLDEAITCYQKALQLNPNFADAYYNLGIMLQGKGKFDEAITCYHKVLQLNPAHADTYNNIGTAFQEKGQVDEAITYYKKASQLNPNFAMAYTNLGNAFQEKEQLDEAITYYKKALQLNPNFAGAYYNLGVVFQDRNQLDEAMTCYQKALQFDPNFVDAYYSIALILLSSGNFKQGWKEYEWRLKKKDHIYCHRNFSQPLWDGYDIAGLTIFLHAEQGLGDTIQFIRYAPLVSQRGAKVIVECQKELTSLVKNVEGIKQVIVYGERLPEFNIHCPLLSLPLIFDTTLESIPAKIPYITVDFMLVQKWRDKVKHDDSKLRVGLVWAGSQRHKKDRYRSCSLDLFSPLAQLDHIAFYSLQKGEAAEQAKNPPKGMKLIDYTEEIDDFSDTAALIENLDLIISVDTAVAHLAGALGKPVWTLLPFAPDWRWMLNREDSPWYPTMRLFRQPLRGDWDSVIGHIVKELNIFRPRQETCFKIDSDEIKT